jgi:proteic killer suppression protein
MLVRFNEERYARLESDPLFTDDRSAAVVKAYRKRMNLIRQAVDERDIRAMRSLHFEKLQGARSHQYSIRVNDQWRLILEFEGEAPNKIVVIVSLEDYH